MNAKSIPIPRVRFLSSELRTHRKKIVFTNGTFDILHAGHVQYLQKARSYGDVLVIGLNSDRSVKNYKNPNRPVNSQKDRLLVLAALACVDYVIIFNTPTPLPLILALKPHILVKGADWKKTEIAGAREVEGWGGRVKRVRLLRGRSTTALIQRIQSQKW